MENSIAWGNDLNRVDKYYYNVALQLSEKLKKPVEVTVYAHSGSVIKGGTGGIAKKGSDGLAGTGCPQPTLIDQAASIPNKYVDLVLVSGGINDVGIGTMANEMNSVDKINSITKTKIKDPMKRLLDDLLAKNENAKVVVTGYYPVISEYSKLDTIDKDALEVVEDPFGKLAATVFGIYQATTNPASSLAKSQAAKKNQEANDAKKKETQVANYRMFYDASNEYLQEAVNTANKNNGGDRVVFVDPKFQDSEAYGTSHSLLYKVRVNGISSTAHPNPDGATRYYNRIMEEIDNKIDKDPNWLIAQPQSNANNMKQPSGSDADERDTTASKTIPAAANTLVTQLKPVDDQPISTSRSNIKITKTSSTDTSKSEIQETTRTTDESTTEETAKRQMLYPITSPPPDESTTEESSTTGQLAEPKFGEIQFGDNQQTVAPSSEPVFGDKANALSFGIPQNAEEWNSRGIALLNQGNYEEAIKAFNEAISLDPDNAAAWNNKGKAFLNQDRDDLAKQCFDIVSEINTNKNNKASIQDQSIFKPNGRQLSGSSFSDYLQDNSKQSSGLESWGKHPKGWGVPESKIYGDPRVGDYPGFGSSGSPGSSTPDYSWIIDMIRKEFADENSPMVKGLSDYANK